MIKVPSKILRKWDGSSPLSTLTCLGLQHNELEANTVWMAEAPFSYVDDLVPCNTNYKVKIGEI